MYTKHNHILKKEQEKTEEPEYKKKEKTIGLVYFDTLYSAIKEGINSQFIIPFALSLKAGTEHIAMISTAPQFVGSFFQLFSSDLLNVVKRRKRVIAFAAMIDSLMWLPILLIPFLWESNYILLINFLIIQAISNAILNPFFNSLLGDTVPQEKRGHVTGRINQIAGITSFFSSIIAGFVLSAFRHSNQYIGFALIFLAAFVTRGISAIIKSRFYEPPADLQYQKESLFHFGLNIRKSNFGQFVMYSSWMKFSVGIAGPFFAVYMLQQLNLDFLTYSLINAGAIISSFIVFRRWGKNIDKQGSRRMLALTGFLVPIVPVFWIIFDRPLILFIVELFSGAVWAGYNLSTSNFVLDATNSKNRLIMTSYYNFFVGAATFAGAMIGGYLMKHLPLDFAGNIFHFIFGISAALRLVFSIYFLNKIKEERFVDMEIKGPKSKIFVSILPRQGAIFDFLSRKK